MSVKPRGRDFRSPPPTMRKESMTSSASNVRTVRSLFMSWYSLAMAILPSSYDLAYNICRAIVRLFWWAAGATGRVAGGERGGGPLESLSGGFDEKPG